MIKDLIEAYKENDNTIQNLDQEVKRLEHAVSFQKDHPIREQMTVEEVERFIALQTEAIEKRATLKKCIQLKKDSEQQFINVLKQANVKSISIPNSNSTHSSVYKIDDSGNIVGITSF
ncbi:MAG: hypothetical protein V4717_22205 [Bacteroidota bacterium]